MIQILRILAFTAMCFNVSATTWRAAYPYTQHTEQQSVTIKAVPFVPFRGNQCPGSTAVYFKNTLLYTIDTYYRGKLFTSEEGIYLAVVHSSRLSGVTSYNSLSFTPSDLDSRAIELFKNGKLLRTYSYRDLVKGSMFDNGSIYALGYNFNQEIFNEAKADCKSCLEDYEARVLRDCDTAEIDLDECEKCQRACYISRSKKSESLIASNSCFVRNNILYIITDKEFIVSLAFSDLSLSARKFNVIIPEKRKFNPPRTIRSYNRKVRYPPNDTLPLTKNGKTIEQGLCELLGKQPTVYGDTLSHISIYIHTLLINRNGRCEDVYTSPSVRGGGKNEYLSGIDEILKTKIDAWLKEQIFDVSTIPEGFAAFNYEDFLYLR